MKKVKDTNLMKLILKSLYKLEPNKKKENLRNIKEISKSSSSDEMPICEFVKIFMSNFQKSCEIFYDFHIDFSGEIGLRDFYGQSFYMDI